MFVLNCFADMPPRDTPYDYKEVKICSIFFKINYPVYLSVSKTIYFNQQTKSPENRAGFPSRLTFSWFDPLTLTGFKRGLTEDDLWPLNPELSSKEALPRFEKYWQKAVRKREA